MTALAEAPKFDLPDGQAAAGARASANGHVVIARPTARWPFITAPKDRAVTNDESSVSWLRGAMIGLGALAAASATVSIAAQYRFVAAARHDRALAGIEACIPDIGALIFACLGIALALRGKRAVRARFLNAGAIATSVFMNYAAAGHGWRDLAIWVMPPVAYALASDTAIANVRSWALVRRGMPDDDSSPLAVLGRMALYVLRFAVARRETWAGARQALLNATPLPEIPAGPERRQLPSPERPKPERKRNGTSKTARFLALVTERHGPLVQIPLDKVSAVAKEVSAEIGLDWGAARTALRKAVLDAQAGGAS